MDFALGAGRNPTGELVANLALGFSLFGGRHQTVVECDATPLAQVTNFATNSE